METATFQVSVIPPSATMKLTGPNVAKIALAIVAISVIGYVAYKLTE